MAKATNVDYDKLEYTLRGAVDEDGRVIGGSFQDKRGLTSQIIKRIAASHGVRHTYECRNADGNTKGSGFTYRCVCDFFSRIVAARMEELGQ